jgi:superkiller protein 3
MSAAQIKSNLKAARDAIAAKDYPKALTHARKVLTFEPANYNANVFAGVSLLNLSQLPDSEQAYRSAVFINPTAPLAWQGLVNLFERTRDVKQLREASLALADIYTQTHVSVCQT